MNNLLSFVKTHLPVISTVLGVVFAVLVQTKVISSNNAIVTLVVSVLASLGIVINHVRIQNLQKTTAVKK